MVLFVAGDIGGTNSRLQLWEVSGLPAGPTQPQQPYKRTKRHSIVRTFIQQQQNKLKEARGGGGGAAMVHQSGVDKPLVVSNTLHETLLGEETYPSPKYETLAEIIQLFLNKHKHSKENVYCMCLAVAGPVSSNRATITNLPWVIDGSELSLAFRMECVSLINDFAGIGYGLLALEPGDLELVQNPVTGPNVPQPEPNPVKAVIGAGTGLGECFLTHNGVNYDVHAAEGGHADFAPRNEVEYKLMEYIKKAAAVDRVSVERVTSGLGIPRIYEFISLSKPGLASKDIEAQIKSKPAEVGRVISEAAHRGACPICVEAMDVFMQTYGAETGNLALKTLPLGGIYIAGGIAAKNMAALRKNNQFIDSFLAKGRMRTILERMPIYLIKHPQVGLLGAKVVCRRIIAQPAGQQMPKMAHTAGQTKIRSNL
jgi:glucokinase